MLPRWGSFSAESLLGSSGGLPGGEGAVAPNKFRRNYCDL